MPFLALREAGGRRSRRRDAVTPLKPLRHVIMLMALLVADATHAAECSGAKQEVFDDFFNRFVVDTAFAQSRTVLPLLTRRWYDDDWLEDVEEPETVWVTQEAYAQRPSVSSESRARHLVPIIKMLASTAMSVELRNAHNSASQALFFKSDAGCWRLWRVDEYTAR